MPRGVYRRKVKIQPPTLEPDKEGPTEILDHLDNWLGMVQSSMPFMPRVVLATLLDRLDRIRDDVAEMLRESLKPKC